MVRLVLISLLATLVTSVAWGQQPNRKPEPYVAPLLPAEATWATTLAAPPAAAGALDDHHVYVPLQDVSTVVEGESVRVPGSAAISALDRATGVARWFNPIESVLPPVAGGDSVFVATRSDLHAVHTLTGLRQWSVPLPSEVRAPMLLRGNLLVALTAPDVLIAIRTDTREVAWRRPIGESGGVLMDADTRAIYLTTERGRVMRVNLADGSLQWDRTLAADVKLSAPGIGGGLVLVGSTTNALWALDSDNGKNKWAWPPHRFFGGDIVGAAVAGDVVYVSSNENQLRALNRDNGNQRWKLATGRPVAPPRAFFGTVVVTALAPTLATFTENKTKTGVAVSSWAAPIDAQLQGAPLIDQNLKPFQVAVVVIMRDGRVTGLRPIGMMFAEPALTPLVTLPGFPLPRERLPGEPEPAPAPVVPGR